MSDEKIPMDGLIVVALNPLMWPNAEPLIGTVTGAVTAENLPDFLHGPFAKTSLEELRVRYGEISQFDRGLFAVPQHPRLFNGIVIPLHNAKAAYVIGHYLSCIALCGVICEMVAIFRFEIANMRCEGKPLDDGRQKLLWGRTFEMWGQKDRIGALDVSASSIKKSPRPLTRFRESEGSICTFFGTTKARNPQMRVGLIRLRFRCAWR